MKTLTQTLFPSFIAFVSLVAHAGCTSNPHAAPLAPQRLDAEQVVIEPAANTERPPFAFSEQDEQLLDEIQRATFRYFIEAVSPETGMVYDRTSSDVVSIAGVGFQLAAFPIGVERGWISRDEAERHAQLILDTLMNEPSNRKAGLFYHFINPHDASARRVGRELVVSTVDSALLFSGMIVAGEYFQGDIKTSVDQLLRDADWSFFLDTPGSGMPDTPYLSLGWKPKDDAVPTGDGELLPYYWIDSGDEHRLTTLLGVCAPKPENRAPEEVYWALRRQLGWHEGQGEIVWFPYSGALFTSFFAHLFVDYGSLGTDNPMAHGMPQRARVDWWENSRRVVNLHRDRAIQNPNKLPSLGEDFWGFSASDGPDGYLVSGQFPARVEMSGAQPDRDFSTYDPMENWGGGVIAPYAPGSSIMFEPALAMESLRASRHAVGDDQNGGVWTESWGFRDAFRMNQHQQVDWVAEDYVAISQGPLILAIENARSGLIWELFMSHPSIRNGFTRLGLK
ncbi:MAG: hypothetical protein CMJ35_15960 [Phycisphaerae bacterium]|nr:hypothetical protein [Phycisphaerae bacterium]MBM93083.1 hypothetical protein [Phycisphaerae bacterium]HCT45358.1 hypothetical protein [Phycisphaerales bacterium]